MFAENLIDKKFTYAVIGATDHKEKYGYKVWRDLLEAGFRAIPVNPRLESIDQEKAYPALRYIPDQIDVVIFVVPPNVTEEILPEVKELGIGMVWLQPGSESEKAIKFCETNNIECRHDACIMRLK